MQDVTEAVKVEIEESPLPKRKGEDERYGSVLDHEHSRRQDAIRSQDGKGMLAAPIAAEMTKLSRSRSSRREQISMAQYRAELDAQTYERDGRIVGPLAPATIINLNPVWLRLSGMMRALAVPPAGYASKASQGGAVRLEHHGRVYQGHYMTIRSPKIWMSITGTHTDRSIGYDTPERAPKHLTPAGIVHQFYAQHVEGFANSQGMGGIIIFEGDIHTIEGDKLARTNNTVWVPRAEKMEVGAGYVYRMYPENFQAFFERMAQMQANYANARMTEAHSFWTTNDPLTQKQITEVDRVWARWSKDMELIETLPEWVTAKLDLKEVQSITRCLRCAKPQLNAAAVFCECGAPFNAFEAYMAGHRVPMEYLELLEGDELDQVRKEMSRRKSKFSDLVLPAPGEENEAPATKPAKSTTRRNGAQK